MAVGTRRSGPDSTDYDEWVRHLAASGRGRDPEAVAEAAVVDVERVGDDVALALESDPEDPGRASRRWPKDVLIGRDTGAPYPASYPTDLRTLAVHVLCRDVAAARKRTRA